MSERALLPDLESLRGGDKRIVAAALAAAERHGGQAELAALLDAAVASPKAHVIGLTGPPGVGKSTLVSSLIGAWRAMDRTVGVVAVDPSSRITGGALLGDRTRMAIDPEDKGVFVRSLAARGRLGGLADLAFAAIVIMRAIYDRVIVETVGVGQSETEIRHVADTVVLCVQPGSGDSLQFMKAGIMESPDIAVVTKADMGAAARRAAADLSGALSLYTAAEDGWPATVLRMSSKTGEGLDDLDQAIDAHWDWLALEGRLDAARTAQLQHWLAESISTRFGSEGLSTVNDELRQAGSVRPFDLERRLCARLSAKLQEKLSHLGN